MILVTGAAGKTGVAIIRHLVKGREPIRALVHRAEQHDVMETLGVSEVIVGDMHQKETLEQAVKSVRGVYHICPSADPNEASMGNALIRAAKAAGVEHFVFHSVLHPQIEALTHHRQKLIVEERLIQSRLSFTILQPTSYMQNVLGTWEQLIHGIYPTMYPLDTRVSLVDLDDVGEVALTVMGNKDHYRASYELSSGEELSIGEIIKLWEKHLGITIKDQLVLLTDWEKRSRQAGLAPERVQTLARMFRYYGEYGFPGNSNVLAWILNRPPTSYESFIKKILKDRNVDRQKTS